MATDVISIKICICSVAILVKKMLKFSNCKKITEFLFLNQFRPPEACDALNTLLGWWVGFHWQASDEPFTGRWQRVKKWSALWNFIDTLCVLFFKWKKIQWLRSSFCLGAENFCNYRARPTAQRKMSILDHRKGFTFSGDLTFDSARTVTAKKFF